MPTDDTPAASESYDEPSPEDFQQEASTHASRTWKWVAAIICLVAAIAVAVVLVFFFVLGDDEAFGDRDWSQTASEYMPSMVNDKDVAPLGAVGPLERYLKGRVLPESDVAAGAVNLNDETLLYAFSGAAKTISNIESALLAGGGAANAEEKSISLGGVDVTEVEDTDGDEVTGRVYLAKPGAQLLLVTDSPSGNQSDTQDAMLAMFETAPRTTNS